MNPKITLLIITMFSILTIAECKESRKMTIPIIEKNLINETYLIHSYLWNIGNGPEDPISFNKNHTVTNKRAGLNKKKWELVNSTTIKIGNINFVYDKSKDRLEGKFKNGSLFAYIYLKNEK